MFISMWQYLYRHFFRFWMKWIFRVFTKKCELQRICDCYVGGERTYKIGVKGRKISFVQDKNGQLQPQFITLLFPTVVNVDGIMSSAHCHYWRPRKDKDGVGLRENALTLSKNQVLQNATFVNHSEVEECVEDIMKEKNINPKKDRRFKICMKACLLQISGYKQLYLDVENVRKSPYDSNNQHHEELLMKLWSLLMPNEKLKARITKQWSDIGFQGDDPKTDFRGMGLLGLVNLVYFSENYTSEAHRILSHSNHPTLGYSYAIVGINLTEMAYSLLKNNALKFHFYNSVPGSPAMEHFHQFYCYLFYEFDKFWFEEEPESIMYFNQYREKFHEKIKRLLLDYRVVLTLKI